MVARRWRDTISRVRGVHLAAVGVAALSTLLLGACGDDAPVDPDGGIDAATAPWTMIHEDLEGALMSIWGASTADVWAVGSDPGDGPMVIHWDGSGWTKLDTGIRGDLWWVYGFADGPVFMGGKDGHILRYEDGDFTLETTPTPETVFGIWGTSPSDMWAVGGLDGGQSGAFAWRRDGESWVLAPGFPTELTDTHGLWKVWGASSTDVWIVGTAAIALHWNGISLEQENLGGGESLFTVHHAAGRFAAVGGFATGLLFENGGSDWESVGASDLPALSGVCLGEDGAGYAVGGFGAFVEHDGSAWVTATGPATAETLHAIWIDPDGGLWTVGGQVLVFPLGRGLVAYRGTDAPTGALR